MDDRSDVMQFMKLLICYLSLLTSVRAADSAKCKNLLDIAIAVDTTSSQTASDFDNVKTELKAIVSGFTIGQSNTRLALISISQQARVVVNFNAVNSVSDFNAAVDSLTFSTDTADLSEAIKVAKDSVLNAARVQDTSKILILVKDRRSVNAAVSGTAVLSRMTSEAAAVKSSGAAVHAVGIGGLWNILELEALFAADYLLFRDKNKALESAKSLNNLLCKANCPQAGTSTQVPGLCYGQTKHVINARVELTENSAGLSVCRKAMDREFATCSGAQRCSSRNRVVSSCGSDGKVTIENSWQSFDYRQQSCVTTKATNKVDCANAMECLEQVADVIFLLDKSGSIGNEFPSIIAATKGIVESMKIGPDNVRVGIWKFGDDAELILQLGEISEKAALLNRVDGISSYIDPMQFTYTHKALLMARLAFDNHGRKGVAKFVFVITDGRSTSKKYTFEETQSIKNAGVTVYAIGIGNVLESELTTMTAPESDTNMFILRNFHELDAWTRDFSKKICIQLADPIPKLCEDNVFVQSISECTLNMQQITRTEYKFDENKKCIKTIQTTVHQNCRPKCTDPTDGNEYFRGDRWTSLCHEFQCSGSATPFVPLKSKCMAADGTCKDVGSQPFKCRDTTDSTRSPMPEISNCQCIEKNGKAVLVFDTE